MNSHKLARSASSRTILSGIVSSGGAANKNKNNNEKNIEVTDNYLMYDANKKYLFINIENIDNITLNLCDFFNFSIDSCYIRCASENSHIKIIANIPQSVKKCKSKTRLKTDLSSVGKNDTNIQKEKEKEKEKEGKKGKNFAIGDMFLITAKTVEFCANTKIHAPRLWIRSSNVIINEKCQINCITSWIESIKFQNDGTLIHIGHCWMNTIKLKNNNNNMDTDDDENKSIFVNHGVIVCHGYFYCHVDNFELADESKVNIGVLSHINVTNNLNFCKESLFNVNGTAYFKVLNDCVINGNVDAESIFIDVLNTGEIGGHLDALSTICIQSKDRIKICGNSNITVSKKILKSTKQLYCLTETLQNHVGENGGPNIKTLLDHHKQQGLIYIHCINGLDCTCEQLGKICNMHTCGFTVINVTNGDCTLKNVEIQCNNVFYFYIDSLLEIENSDIDLKGRYNNAFGLTIGDSCHVTQSSTIKIKQCENVKIYCKQEFYLQEHSKINIDCYNGDFTFGSKSYIIDFNLHCENSVKWLFCGDLSHFIDCTIDASSADECVLDIDNADFINTKVLCKDVNINGDSLSIRSDSNFSEDGKSEWRINNCENLNIKLNGCLKSDENSKITVNTKIAEITIGESMEIDNWEINCVNSLSLACHELHMSNSSIKGGVADEDHENDNNNNNDNDDSKSSSNNSNSASNDNKISNEEEAMMKQDEVAENEISELKIDATNTINITDCNFSWNIMTINSENSIAMSKCVLLCDNKFECNTNVIKNTETKIDVVDDKNYGCIFLKSLQLFELKDNSIWKCNRFDIIANLMKLSKSSSILVKTDETIANLKDFVQSGQMIDSTVFMTRENTSLNVKEIQIDTKSDSEMNETNEINGRNLVENKSIQN